MKRWMTVLGRGGTVLISISLALFLVSLIPQIQATTARGSFSLPPESVQIVYTQVLTPQRGLQANMTTQGALHVYLLEAGTTELFPDLGTMSTPPFLNITGLQKFLDANPERLIEDYGSINGYFERYYVPPRILNATLVVSNPGSSNVGVNYEIAITSSVAPTEKVRNIAYWAAPIGIILAIPWFAEIWKHRKQI
jgi:hypothetical protein